MSPAESTGFTPPAAFGPYRVLHQIGSGVLGPVFRTYDPQNDRLVAVKAFRLEIVPEDVARLAESLRRLPSSELSHPGIVKAIDAGLEGMSAFLAMEYVSAETLDVALRHLAPSPLDRALPLISDIAEAIEAAWAAGYGHGSLHPRDVFVASGTNEVRVTGFGVGQALEAAGIKVPPRRPYTAPERSTGGPWDIRADVYSLGAIAHELLTKRRPGGAGEQDGSLVTGTTPEQRRLIRGVLGAALAEAPEHRFHSARAFVTALGAIVRGEAVGPLPEGPSAAVESVESKDEPKAEPEPKPEPKPAIEEPKKPAGRRSQTPAEKPTPLFAAIETPAAEPETPPAAQSESPPAVAVVAADASTATQPHASAPSPPHAAHPIEIQHVAPISAHDASHAPYGHSALSITHASTFATDVASADKATSRFPWAAVAAGLVAGVFLGFAGGFWYGSNHSAPQLPAVAAPATPAPEPVALATPPAIPPGTDVVVPKETAPVSTPLAAATQTPAPPEQKPAPVKSTKPPAQPTPAPAPTAAKVVKPPVKPPVTAAAKPGSLYLDSRPTGARVFLDGKDVGKTPLTLPDIKAGSHPLRFELAGHKTLDTTVTVRPGQQERVTVTLEQALLAPPDHKSQITNRKYP